MTTGVQLQQVQVAGGLQMQTTPSTMTRNTYACKAWQSLQQLHVATKRRAAPTTIPGPSETISRQRKHDPEVCSPGAMPSCV